MSASMAYLEGAKWVRVPPKLSKHRPTHKAWITSGDGSWVLQIW